MVGCNMPTRFAATAPRGVPTVSLMTYNVNFGLAGDRQTLDAIERPDVDVFCLQEVTRAWETSLRSRFVREYPHQAYHGDDGYTAGFPILWKWPIESIEQLPKVDWCPNAPIIRSPIGPLQILNLHLRPPRHNSGSVVVGYFSTRRRTRAQVSPMPAISKRTCRTFVIRGFQRGQRRPRLAAARLSRLPQRSLNSLCAPTRGHGRSVGLPCVPDTITSLIVALPAW